MPVSDKNHIEAGKMAFWCTGRGRKRAGAALLCMENVNRHPCDGADAPGICSDHGGAAVALETEPSVLRTLRGKDAGQQERAGARLPGLRSDGISKDLPGSYCGDHEREQTSYVALPRQPQYLPWLCADRWICRDRGDI